MRLWSIYADTLKFCGKLRKGTMLAPFDCLSCRAYAGGGLQTVEHLDINAVLRLWRGIQKLCCTDQHIYLMTSGSARCLLNSGSSGQRRQRMRLQQERRMPGPALAYGVCSRVPDQENR